jgi:uncharacterized protein (DUF1499 family)
MRRVAILGLTISTLAGLAGLVAAFGYRLGLLPLRLALLTILQYSAYAGAAGAVISLLALIGLLAARGRAGSIRPAVAGVVVGAIIFGVPGRLRYESSKNGYPPIHDISTDTENPPAFVEVLPLRKDAPNTTVYGGPKIAAQQKRAYPDLAPTVLDVAPDRAFDRALSAVNSMGWDLVAANRDAKRIEATDTTVWFGFKDDVIVRLQEGKGGTIVDVRSLSRVGGGDVGTNAKRIRAYLERLKSQS